MAQGDGVDTGRNEFERIALIHMDAIYNSALRLTGNTSDAEDLVQETFLKAYRFFHRFREDSNCLAWLFKIMKNSYINRFRKKAREPITVSINPVQFGDNLGYIEPRDMSSNPEDEVLGKLLDDEVEQAIQNLPEEFKLVVLFSDVEGLQYKEIADILGCPIGTVRSRLSRGRHLLRKELSSYAKDHGYLEND